MEHIKMSVTEEKNAIVYRFSYGYVGRNEELTFVQDVVTARRSGDKWTFDYAAVQNQNANQFETFRKTLDKVNQVVETNATNLFGITVEKAKVAATTTPAPVAPAQIEKD